MRAIYKYLAGPPGEFTVTMPKGAKVLSCHNQRETPYMWAVADPDEPVERRRFYLAGTGTGHPLEYNPDYLRFIGTALFAEGTLVYHLFEFV